MWNEQQKKNREKNSFIFTKHLLHFDVFQFDLIFGTKTNEKWMKNWEKKFFLIPDGSRMQQKKPKERIIGLTNVVCLESVFLFVFDEISIQKIHFEKIFIGMSFGLMMMMTTYCTLMNLNLIREKCWNGEKQKPQNKEKWYGQTIHLCVI